jgi:hypothetical protein
MGKLIVSWIPNLGMASASTRCMVKILNLRHCSIENIGNFYCSRRKPEHPLYHLSWQVWLGMTNPGTWEATGTRSSLLHYSCQTQKWFMVYILLDMNEMNKGRETPATICRSFIIEKSPFVQFWKFSLNPLRPSVDYKATSYSTTPWP